MDVAIFWQHLIFFSYLILINAAAFFVFAADKLFAAARAWRVRERTLLMLAVAGGSAGALLAMRIFHHKTKKPRFGFLFAIILLTQIALIFFLLNQGPANLPALDLLF